MNPCPVCNMPVPSNEWTAYQRHEDCAIVVRGTLAVLPTKYEPEKAIKRGGPGQDPKRGEMAVEN